MFIKCINSNCFITFQILLDGWAPYQEICNICTFQALGRRTNTSQNFRDNAISLRLSCRIWRQPQRTAVWNATTTTPGAPHNHWDSLDRAHWQMQTILKKLHSQYTLCEVAPRESPSFQGGKTPTHVENGHYGVFLKILAYPLKGTQR